MWGGRRLSTLGKPLEEQKHYGESWRSRTRGDGRERRGRYARRSVIANGAACGQDDPRCLAPVERGLLGLAKPAGDGASASIKFLDARQHLSVQVHLTPAYAAANPGARSRQCWYVLSAETGERGEEPVISRGSGRASRWMTSAGRSRRGRCPSC